MRKSSRGPNSKTSSQAQWDERRRKDIDYIYNINSSAHFSDVSGPEFATFRDHYGQLYNNPMLQRYLNTIGQRLVPKDSPNIYSFKILLDPIPKAESFSTGTVLVSTGLISMLDNEAQLAYVLGHEIAHVEKNHFYEALRMATIEDALNKEKEESVERKRAIFTAAVTAGTAGLGTGVANGLKGALIGGALGLGSGAFLSKLIFRDHTTVTEWPDIFENDADETSIGYILDQNYDVREAPKLYARMENAAKQDPRIGLGFIAQASRMKARNAKIQELLSGPLKPAIEAKLKGAGLTGSSGEFNLIMATLKRDNGIIAIDYDLFAMARDNLEEAVSLRTDDPRAQLYLGKVISLTARNDQDRQEAEEHFMKAIQYDESRGAYPDPASGTRPAPDWRKRGQSGDSQGTGILHRPLPAPARRIVAQQHAYPLRLPHARRRDQLVCCARRGHFYQERRIHSHQRLRSANSSYRPRGHRGCHRQCNPCSCRSTRRHPTKTT